MSNRGKKSGFVQLLVAGGVSTLILASGIMGYGSSLLSAAHGTHAYGSVSSQIAMLNRTGEANQDPSTEGQGPSDPIVDYKAALDVLKHNYYGSTVDTKETRKLTYAAIRGMLGSLKDQFTSFLDPDEWAQFHATTQGNFEGIGAFLEPDGLFVKVARPIETGPAEKVGIKSDDVIVKVNHESMKGKDINYVVHHIKGPRGTKVIIDVLRDNKPLEFTVTRELVEPPIVHHWMEDSENKIGHIELDEFNEKSMEQLELAYDDLEKQGMKALVFDLRSNPGGLLDVAIQVASAFIPRDTDPSLNNAVVIIHDGNGREAARTLIGSDYTHKRIPLVVLVNDRSASASEIVTAAIKDYGIGTIMGERTFGKGKVQTLYPLDDGSALRLTTQLYYPPKHYDINFKHDDNGDRVPDTGGIVPDITVKPSPKWHTDDFKDKVNDLQLQKALVFLRAKLKGMDTAQATAEVARTQ
jgi:carboxyl-terminal processing protease